MERYILKYLMENTDDVCLKKFIYYNKLHLEMMLWSYGKNITYDWESTKYGNPHTEKELPPNPIPLTKKFKRLIKRFILPKVQNHSIQSTSISKHVLSLVSFHKSSISKFYDMGIALDMYGVGKYYELREMENWISALEFKDFNELIYNRSSYDKILIYIEDCKKLARKYDALFLSVSDRFIAKILLDAFKSENKPTFIFLHGLPAIYKQTNDNLSDFLVVYSEQIKKNYVDAGYDSSKIIVGGNSKYPNTSIKNKNFFKNNLSNVLVLTTSHTREIEDGWNYDSFNRGDRSLLILWLLSVENVLKKNGVSKARLRPHPSVSKDWLSHYVDMSFYELDYLDLTESLQQATLAIGPTSTTLLESVLNGVNYLCYEPGEGKHDLKGINLVNPFDGSYEKLKVAKSEYELDQQIKTNHIIDSSIIDDYMEPFQPEKILRYL